MINEDFRIRPYSKRELAELYFPGRGQSATAVANLRNLMLRNTLLMQELQAVGYLPRQHLLTAPMVRLIVQHLGEP